MAEEEIIGTEEIQEETKTEELKEETKEEVNTKEVPDEEEEKKGFIERTIEKLGIGGGTNVKDKIEEEGELISEKFTDAAVALGWTDEDIIKFAEIYSNEYFFFLFDLPAI